jgi:DNA-binding PadR family transcriptional regulator
MPPMPGFRTGRATPQMMVLGLLIQRPDSIAGVARRLADSFPSAGFGKTTAHKNVPSLEKKGYIRLIAKGPPGEPTQNRYGSTSAGGAHFRNWLRGTEMPPVIVDAFQCKLEFFECEDLAAMIRAVREEEEAYTLAYDIARRRVLHEQRSKRARGASRGGSVAMAARRQSILNKDEANLMGMMSKRLEHLGDELEKLLEELSAGGGG